MRLGFIRLVVLVSAFILSGAPSALMQVGAWAVMIGQRGEGDQAAASVARVIFLGKSPCHRCLVVAEAVSKSQGEDKDVWELSGMRLISSREDRGWFPSRYKEQPLLVFTVDILSAVKRSDQPLTPPPRPTPVS